MGRLEPACGEPAPLQQSPVKAWAGHRGCEQALLPHWTLRAEYLYARLAHGFGDAGNIGFANRVFVTDAITLQIARVGLNYNFR